jgi:hypothetical protein
LFYFGIHAASASTVLSWKRRGSVLFDDRTLIASRVKWVGMCQLVVNSWPCAVDREIWEALLWQVGLRMLSGDSFVTQLF